MIQPRQKSVKNFIDKVGNCVDKYPWSTLVNKLRRYDSERHPEDIGDSDS